MAGARVDDEVVADALVVEIAFVVARSRHGDVAERNAGHHLVRVIGMADGHQPRPTQVIAEDAAVAACADHGVPDAARLEDLDTAIDRVSLADAAQVDTHAGMLEAHRVMLLIEQHVAPVDRRQGFPDLRFGRMDVAPVVVGIADAPRAGSGAAGTAATACIARHGTAASAARMNLSMRVIMASGAKGTTSAPRRPAGGGGTAASGDYGILPARLSQIGCAGGFQ